MKLTTLFVIFCVCFVSKYTSGDITESPANINTNVNQKIDDLKQRGYDYIPEVNAVYKLHRTPEKLKDAINICDDEDATLYYPNTEKESKSIMAFMQNKYKDSFPTEFLLGLKRSGNMFETVDGTSASKVYTNWNKGEPNNAGGQESCVVFETSLNGMNDVSCDRTFLYMCKIRLNDWNKNCNLPNTEYGYSEEFGKCYKFHLTPKNWTEAQEKCRAEQSQLAVINSHEEAAYLVRLTQKTIRSVPGRFTHGVVLLGFHNNNVEDWQTIEGTSLYYSGYACWGNYQPDGGERDRCGSMFYNGHLNDINCADKAFFICEHQNTELNYVHEPHSFFNVIQAVRCHDTI